MNNLILQMKFMVFLLALCSHNSINSQKKHQKFHSVSEQWKDNNGVHINAHGGAMLLDGHTFLATY